MIHPTAIISATASIADDVDVGPYTVIGDHVEIGGGSKIDSHVVINGPTKIGADNHIYQFVSMGDDPQDKKYAGEPTQLIIGDRNTIREFCTISRGSSVMWEEFARKVSDSGVAFGNDATPFATASGSPISSQPKRVASSPRLIGIRVACRRLTVTSLRNWLQRHSGHLL